MISIIIPIKNASLTYLDNMINALNYQNYHEEHEVIFVDYGSDFKYLQKIENKLSDSFTFIHSKCENDTPYEARNIGITESRGDIIVLLDLYCVPVTNWLKSGTDFLKKNSLDLVAGSVFFDFEGKITTAKVFDSLFNVKMKESVKFGNYAKGGNLFIRRDVFDKIGLFPKNARSGADVLWTKKATDNGLLLGYCYDSMTHKYAYSYISVIKKMWRVSKGQKKLKLNTMGKRKPFYKIFNYNHSLHMEHQKNVPLDRPNFLKLRLFFFALFMALVSITAKRFSS